MQAIILFVRGIMTDSAALATENLALRQQLAVLRRIVHVNVCPLQVQHGAEVFFLRGPEHADTGGHVFEGNAEIQRDGDFIV